MKYWTQLNNLESQIIRLETMRSLFSLMASGAEESSPDDIRNALWYVEGSLTDIHANLRSEFNELWEVVSNDDTKELVEKVKDKHKGGMKKKKQMTDRELP
jgi:hypothetical protein